MGQYNFLVEYDAALAEPYIIRGTLRAYRHSDNPFSVFIRTEDGPMDLSAVETLEAIVLSGTAPGLGWWDYGLGPGWRPLLTIPAFSPIPGRVMFTVPASNLRTVVFNSVNTLFVRADNRTIYSALLEIVN